MGRPSNTEQRRAEIAEALLKVMSREGYERSTIAAIARAARLRSGLLHYHFEDKHQILVALVQRLVATLDQRVSAKLAAAKPGAQAQLDALLDAHLELGADADPRAVSAWVVIGTEALREPDVRRLYAGALGRTLERLEERVSDCLAETGRSRRHARRIAAALLAAIEGAYRVSVSAPGLLPEGFAAPMLRRMAHGLIEAEERG